ncbi:MAG: hypothetical protein AAFY42_12190 [Pseudomonadota bacterium]
MFITAAATCKAELEMRLRNRASYIQILAVVALSAALVPFPGAPYSIVRFGDQIPQMSVDTTLVAAAVVLNLILIGVLPLSFDQGRLRDARQRMTQLMHTQPTSLPGVAIGRLAAVAAFAAILITAAIFMLSTTLFARFGMLPALFPYGVFLLLVAPAMTTAAIMGAALDLFASLNAAVRVGAALFLWLAAVGSSLAGGVDVIGASALMRLAGRPSDTALSIGFVSSEGVPSLQWNEFADASQVALSVLQLSAVLSVLALVLVAASSWRLRSATREFGSKRSSVQMVHIEEQEKASIERMAKEVLALPPALKSHASLPSTLLLLIGRLTKQAKAWPLLLLAGFAVGISSTDPGVSLLVILASALIACGRSTFAEIKVAAAIEACEPALARPNSELLQAFAILLPMVCAAIPAFLQIGVIQSATAIAGMFALVRWLSWTHRVIARPILGISLAGVSLYTVAFNRVPAAADVFGIWQSSPIALLIASLFAFGLVWLPQSSRS